MLGERCSEFAIAESVRCASQFEFCLIESDVQLDLVGVREYSLAQWEEDLVLLGDVLGQQFAVVPRCPG